MARRRVRVCGLYLPNGNPAPGPKYDYKLGWMARMQARVEALLQTEEALVCCGDYNVIPQAEDAARPELWLEDALYLPQTRAAFRRLCNLGLTDAFRARNQSAGAVFLLGLSGGRVGAQQRHPHRPSAAFAAGGRPAARRPDRQAGAGGRQAL